MPITIDNVTYDNLFSLAKDIHAKSDLFAKALRTPELLSFVSEQDEAKGERLKKLSLLSLPDDVFVFKAGEILNPFLPFSFRGVSYPDYAAFGKAMLSSSPNADAYLLEVLRYRLISEHMETSGYSKEYPKTYEKVLEIEGKEQDDILFAYFSLGYYLSGFKGIIYDHVEYKDIYNLCYYLIKKEKDLNALGTYLANSSLLLAYSDYAPDGREIKEYLHLSQEVDKSEEKLASFLASKKGKETP